MCWTKTKQFMVAVKNNRFNIAFYPVSIISLSILSFVSVMLLDHFRKIGGWVVDYGFIDSWYYITDYWNRAAKLMIIEAAIIVSFASIYLFMKHQKDKRQINTVEFRDKIWILIAKKLGVSEQEIGEAKDGKKNSKA